VATIFLTLKGGEEGCSIKPASRHPVDLWTIKRRVTPWGHFVVASINASKHVIDGSLPTELDSIPRDAKPVPADLVERIWHDQSGSHVFGDLSDPGGRLKQAVSSLNEGEDAEEVAKRTGWYIGR
jgi:hypothetical protein